MNIPIKQIQNQHIFKCKFNCQILYLKYGFKTSVKIRIKNKFQNMDQNNVVLKTFIKVDKSIANLYLSHF